MAASLVLPSDSEISGLPLKIRVGMASRFWLGNEVIKANVENQAAECKRSCSCRVACCEATESALMFTTTHKMSSHSFSTCVDLSCRSDIVHPRRVTRCFSSWYRIHCWRVITTTSRAADIMWRDPVDSAVEILVGYLRISINMCMPTSLPHSAPQPWCSYTHWAMCLEARNGARKLD